MVALGEPRETSEGLVIRGVEWEADRVSASIVLGDEEYRVWFAASEEFGREADFLLPFTLVHAMRTRSRLELPGAVSPRLLSAVPKIQAFFNLWDDEEFHRVPVDVGGVREEANAERGSGVGCFFSGGVDSFYTLLKHRDEVTHLILLHGFDISLKNRTLRARASRAAREVARELGKDLIEVETNIRDVLLGRIRPDQRDKYHGAVLASSALLFQHRFRKVLIAASHDYAGIQPRPSHPLLDPLWGTELTDFEHDGLEATRPDKVSYISEYELPMEWLRVCLKNLDDAYNCGRCEKCLRTMINLRAAGALDRCKTLPSDLNLQAIADMNLAHPAYRALARQNLKALERLGTEPELKRALEEALRKSQKTGGDTHALLTEVRNLRKDNQKLAKHNQKLAKRNSRLTARYSKWPYKLVNVLIDSIYRVTKIGKSARRNGTSND